MPLQDIEDVVDMGPVSSSVLLFGFPRFSFRVDSQVIHVDRHPSLGDLSAEDHIHHHLEGGRRVG